MKEKIYIYVPKEIEEKLKADATMFEIYKSDGKNINRNRFLSMIIMGYYDDYAEEAKKTHDKIYSILKNYLLNDDEKNIIANTIFTTIINHPSPQDRKGFTKLSLKPTKDTESRIEKINKEAGVSESISRYFCRLLESYCKKPFSERERIVFKKNCDLLKEYCSSNTSITFKTIWNAELLHEVIPYKVIPGPEEMFNYLLCAETNEETGLQEAKSYRLNRIDTINSTYSTRTIDDRVKRYLDLMIKHGPAYAINDDVESCVRMSAKGIINYSRVYFGRPEYDRLEEKTDGTYYYFKCSKDQVYLYFRRFAADEAEIIFPKELRDKMITFHSNACNAYQMKEV